MQKARGLFSFGSLRVMVVVGLVLLSWCRVVTGYQELIIFKSPQVPVYCNELMDGSL